MDHMQQFVQELKIGTTLQEIWEIALENKRKEKKKSKLIMLHSCAHKVEGGSRRRANTIHNETV